ncbi:MAG: sugar phosphate isomerase/epimerase family protein [Chloroflexota bacterium]
MKYSCCIWALSDPESDVLTHMADLGFTWIDLQPHTFSSAEAIAQMKALNLQVSCVGASFGIPQPASLDHEDETLRQEAVAHLLRALDFTKDMGADVVYVIPGMDDSEAALNRYAASLITAADQAAEIGIKVGIEHFPEKALPTASGTLAFLEKINHPNLYLLFDLGHIQISKEDPAAVIKEAGDRLAYVHLDDNDGEGDFHWSLLDGVMTKDTLKQTFNALDEIGYRGAISLELSPKLDNPLTALRDSQDIVLDVMANRSEG